MNRLQTTWIFLFLALLQTCFAPPVDNKSTKDNEINEADPLEDVMEYHRYLREVVEALESDPDFRKKLEGAKEEDIKSGKIAHELQFVSHHIRNKLDEIKRVELERLKDLIRKKQQLMGQVDVNDPNHHGHLDHANPHTFEIEDLKKLISKATADLAEADKLRKEEFKHYEMEKEYEKQVKLNSSDVTQREKLQKEFEEMENKHKKHEKLHEPGHKAQLEEVWEKQDQMQQDFDPKTFFMLHDLDSNGLLDQNEIKALFIKELDKLYNEGLPEDDMRERAEEMERMREAVFKEVDTNRDGFIDFDEFLEQTKRDEFNRDRGWQALDEQQVYSKEEWEQFVRQQQLMSQGHHPGQVPVGYPNVQYQQVPQGYHQVPQGYQQVPQAQYVQHGQVQHPNLQQQNINYQQYQQMPPQVYQGNNIPQQGYMQHPAQGASQGIPQQRTQQGVPPQAQFAVPQTHGAPQQVPHGVPQQVPHGVPQQIPQGVQQQGVPQGLPQQVQQGLPQQVQQGLPQQVQQGVPQQVQQNIQQQVPQGVPQQVRQGVPQGMPQQLPQQAPQGVPPVPQGAPQQGLPPQVVPQVIPNQQANLPPQNNIPQQGAVPQTGNNIPQGQQQLPPNAQANQPNVQHK